MSADARRYLIAVVLLVVMGSAAEAVRVTRVPPAAYHPNFANIPLAVGVYTGHDLPVDQSVYAFLAAAAMIEREYVSPSEPPVQMTVLYAPDWRSIHSPEGCFPNQGWQELEEKKITIPAPPGFPIPGPLNAKLTRMEKDEHQILVLFSFAYYGGTTSNWEQMGYKIALGPRGAGGVLFTLATPLESADTTAAVNRLYTILGAAYPAAINFWYQGKK
jgi:hypothetical protein